MHGRSGLYTSSCIWKILLRISCLVSKLYQLLNWSSSRVAAIYDIFSLCSVTNTLNIQWKIFKKPWKETFSASTIHFSNYLGFGCSLSNHVLLLRTLAVTLTFSTQCVAFRMKIDLPTALQRFFRKQLLWSILWIGGVIPSKKIPDIYLAHEDFMNCKIWGVSFRTDKQRHLWALHFSAADLHMRTI